MIVRNARRPGDFRILAATPPDRGILGEIEAFLARSGMSESRFSRECSNDFNLIPTLRAGRIPGPKMQARIRAFIAERSAS